MLAAQRECIVHFIYIAYNESRFVDIKIRGWGGLADDRSF